MSKKAYAGVAAVASVVLLVSVRRRRLSRMRLDATPQVTLHAPECGLSVLVEPAALSDGWAVAPPLFYPPWYAIVPIVRHTDGAAVPEGPRVQDGNHQRDQNEDASPGFILCDASEVGSLVVCASDSHVEDRLARFCATNPVLSGLPITSATPLTPVADEFYAEKTARALAAAAAATKSAGTPASTAVPTEVQRPFTHVVELPCALVYLGTNALYCHAAVFWRTNADDSEALREASQKVVNACHLAPLAPAKHRADELHARCAPGAADGAFHVYYLHKSKLLHFCSPPSVRVVHLRTLKDEPSCVFKYSARCEASPSRIVVPVTTAALDRLAAAPKATTPFSLADFLELEPSATPDAAEASPERRVASTVSVTVEEGARLSEKEGLAVLYQQPSLGAFFSVQPGGAVVDAVLTNSPHVLYYPFGMDPLESTNPAHPAKPHLTLQSVSPLPSTWESTDKGDDVFIHNVLFHLTEWDKHRTTCTFAEISGMRCAQFQEEKEGRCCRTYVLLRKNSLLLMRWETDCSEWDGQLPTLQYFIDTLHLDV